MKPEEKKYLKESRTCEACGHLEALHNYHCCEFCTVPDCECQWGQNPYVPPTPDEMKKSMNDAIQSMARGLEERRKKKETP